MKNYLKVNEMACKNTCRAWFRNLVNILPSDIKHQFTKEAFIVGGCIRSMLLGEKVKDIDICFKENSDLIPKLKALNLGYASSNAVTFYVDKQQYQFIWVDMNSPQKVIDGFDYTMNMNYFSYNRNVLKITDLYSILNKQLVLNPACRNPIGTLARISKFVKRGYQVPSILDMLRLATEISYKPINTYDELESWSRLYISEKDFVKISFVNKSRVKARRVESGDLIKTDWHFTRSGEGALPEASTKTLVETKKETHGDSQ